MQLSMYNFSNLYSISWIAIVKDFLLNPDLRTESKTYLFLLVSTKQENDLNYFFFV